MDWLHRYKDALEALDEMNLLPVDVSHGRSTSSPLESSQSLVEAANRFVRLPATILALGDDVVLLAMECITSLHTSAHSHINGVASRPGDIGAGRAVAGDRQMHILKQRAALMVSFAGLVQGKFQRQDTFSLLARMELRMV